MEVKLYKNIMPNVDNNIHYYFTQVNDYYTFLASKLYKTIDNDNFRYNANILKISTNQLSNLEELKDITYIAIHDSKEFNEFFLVKSHVVQSGYVIFLLANDIWATNIYKADINDIFVNKCNLRIFNEVGFFDKISLAKREVPYSPILKFKEFNYKPLGGTPVMGAPREYYESVKAIKESEVSVICILSGVVNQNTATSEKTTATLCVAFKLSDIRSAIETQANITFNEKANMAEIGIRTVSGIFGTEASGLLANFVDAKVLKCCLMLNSNLEYVNPTATKGILTKTPYSDKIINLPAQAVVANTYVYEFDLGKLNQNYKWYFGAPNNGLELVNYIEDNIVNVFFTINNSNFSVIVSQADNEKNITSSFEVPLLGNSEQLTLNEFTSLLTKNLTDIVGSLTRVVSSTSVLEGVSNSMSLVSNVVNMHNRSIAQASGTIGNGDGIVTFSYLLKAVQDDEALKNTNICYPFVLTYYKSIFDEEVKTNLGGANYGCKVSSIGNLSANKFINTGIDKIYLQANCVVSGVQLDACNEIQNKLATGIYFKAL